MLVPLMLIPLVFLLSGCPTSPGGAGSVGDATGASVTLSGTITSQKMGILSATVTIRNGKESLSEQVSVGTDQQTGTYSITGVAPGTYDVVVTLECQTDWQPDQYDYFFTVNDQPPGPALSDQEGSVPTERTTTFAGLSVTDSTTANLLIQPVLKGTTGKKPGTNSVQ